MVFSYNMNMQNIIQIKRTYQLKDCRFSEKCVKYCNAFVDHIVSLSFVM